MVEDQRSEVVDAVTDGEAGARALVHPRRQTAVAHLARVRPRGVQDRAAGPVDGPGVVAVERPEVVGVGSELRADVGQPFPAAADPEDLVAHLGRAVDDALDDGVEARDVAAAGQDPDALQRGHSRDMLARGPLIGRLRFGAARGDPAGVVC